ncbi:MAG TPA: hypothetical protein VKV17_12835 [Bryobacteraceae bacterium]|nr:hypothetical protein [Bryobacteraceae bacterium]
MTHVEERKRIVAEAISWLNTPYHSGAQLKGVGVDCGRLPLAIYAACGFDLPWVVPQFAKDWHLHAKEERYLAIVSQYLTEVPEPEPGDMVLFHLRASRVFNHGGIVIEWPRIIHAPNFRKPGKVQLTDIHQVPLLNRPVAVKFFTPFRTPDANSDS